MAIKYGLLVVLLGLSLGNARPADPPAASDLLDVDAPLAGGDATASSSGAVDPREISPRLYLIVAEADEDGDDAEPEALARNVEKRSAEEADDLEAAAGTNVLRPLFVYRQQLAYRERVKKGAIKRFGFRPRF